MRDIQLDSGVTSKVYISPVSILRDTRVSSIIVRWNPIFFKLESLDRRCALKFFSLGTCSNLKYVECIDKLHTLWRYFNSCGSLAWYFPATWLSTSWELIFAFNLEAPISREITMLTMRASYSAWLLLSLNSHFSVCLISMSPGPSNTIPRPFSFTFEEPSTESVHYEGTTLYTDELILQKKKSKACDLMLPLWWYEMS